MDARRIVALALVLSLTGGAMAAGNTYMSHGADGVSVVQQHSVFVELVLEDSDKVEEIHEFGAVVGLVKECKQQQEVFDNAVLWFNDQFLFGDKASDAVPKNVSEDPLGHQPPQRTYDKNGSVDEVLQDWEWGGDDQDPGFLGANQFRERWGGCFIPDGFMHAIGHDDPYGASGMSVQQGEPEEDSSNHDDMRHLITLDNQCHGCIFEYEGTFYITDPNGVEWMVDKLVYPGSFQGDVFASGGGDDCYDGSGLTGFEDHRSTGVHADQCEDNGTGADNHRSYDGNHTDGDRTSGALVEPIYTVHVQVDPSTGTGYADEADWQYADETKDDAPRKGMPYAQDENDALYDLCKNELRDQARPCAIEYNFLLAIDFAAFENSVNRQQDNVTHGDGDQSAAEGDSHPHNPHTKDRGPQHEHSTVDLDLFFYAKKNADNRNAAPYFVMENPYWDENGAPPSVQDDCSQTDPDGDYSTEREQAVEDRAALVCNTSSNDGQFHMHDGSQSM